MRNMTRFLAKACLAIFCSMAAVGIAQASNEKVTYTIKAVDINGTPVVGVEVAALEVIYDYADTNVPVPCWLSRTPRISSSR